MAVWAGLGYYRRLRSLRAAAQFVCKNGWPSDLRELPGVGEYTAAALGSIAFGTQVACADGNVRRVMSRLNGRTLSLKESEVASQEMMGSFTGKEWNQAVMELGAVVCTRAPNCVKCPVNRNCVAYASGTVDGLPLAKIVESVSIEHVCACVIKDGHIALRKSLPGEWWSGLLVFPYSTVARGEDAISVARRLGLQKPQPLGTIRHTVTKHRIRLNAFCGSGSPMGVDWHPISHLHHLPLPSPQRRVVQLLERAA
jgi:A/G-specific adenine glycosylase